MTLGRLADVNLSLASELPQPTFSTTRAPYRDNAWPTSWAMRFVVFTCLHVESAIDP